MRCALMMFLLAGGQPLLALEYSASPNTFEPVTTTEASLTAEPPAGYLARIERNNPAEVKATLKRAEEIYLSGELDEALPPVTFIIHGPEAKIFLKENYDMYMGIVDLAARLSSLNVVDIKVCRTRLGVMKAKDKPLQPFVGTVEFGPKEAKRLRGDEGYEYFYPTADAPSPASR